MKQGIPPNYRSVRHPYSVKRVVIFNEVNASVGSCDLIELNTSVGSYDLIDLNASVESCVLIDLNASVSSRNIHRVAYYLVISQRC